MFFEILNDFLLATFLFCFFLCLFLFMCHGIPDSIAQADKVNEPELPDYKAVFSEQNDPDPEEIEDELETADLWADNTAIKQSVDHPTEQETTGEDNDLTLLFPKLKQSHLRKLCTPLGIKPMIKGKWLSTAKIRELLQEQAHTQPQQFMEVLQAKLPEFTATILQHQSKVA